MKKLRNTIILIFFLPLPFFGNGQGSASLEILNDSLELYKKNGEQHLQADLLRKMAQIHYDKGNHAKTLDFNLQELAVRTTLNDSIEVTQLHFYIGNAYSDASKFDKAIDHYLKAMEINAYPLISAVKVPTNIGLLFLNEFGDNEKAKQYFSLALSNAREMKDDEGRGKAYLAFGQLYEKEKRFDFAEKLYEQATTAYEKTGSTVKTGRCQMALGRLCLENNKRDKALIHFSKANKLFESGSYLKYEIRSLYELGRLHFDLGNYNIAKDFLEESIAKSSVNQPDIENVSAYKLLALVNEKMGIYDKAFLFQSKFIEINDSISSRKELGKFLQLEHEVQDLIKERDTAIQMAKLEQNNARLRIWIISIAALALLSMLATSFYLYRKRSVESLLEKTKELNDIQLEKLKKQQQLESARSFLSGQEEERKRLSQELHDSLSLQLANIKMRLSNYQYKLETEKMQNKLDPIINDLTVASSDVRNISHALSPMWLEKYGLIASVNDIIFKLESSYDNLDISFDHENYSNQLISKYTSLSLYQTISELLNNVIKHAQANEVKICLSNEAETVRLKVEDNGIGYNPLKIDRSGIGLKNIEARIGFLGGIFEISNKKDGGMLHEITLPVEI